MEEIENLKENEMVEREKLKEEEEEMKEREELTEDEN